MNRRRIEPKPGQESVWDYPRPPRLEECGRRIRIVASEISIVETTESFRVLETSHPPVFYFPTEFVRMDLMHLEEGGSFCEWKGHAHYYALQLPDRVIHQAAWCYKTPTLRFDQIAGYLAFYPGKMDQCYVDDELVTAQQGDFYGGWITSDIVGPFKGGPTTLGW
jgi:uncharacterized protein (DUF427 family)